MNMERNLNGKCPQFLIVGLTAFVMAVPLAFCSFMVYAFGYGSIVSAIIFFGPYVGLFSHDILSTLDSGGDRSWLFTPCLYFIYGALLAWGKQRRTGRRILKGILGVHYFTTGLLLFLGITGRLIDIESYNLKIDGSDLVFLLPAAAVFVGIHVAAFYYTREPQTR